MQRNLKTPMVKTKYTMKHYTGWKVQIKGRAFEAW